MNNLNRTVAYLAAASKVNTNGRIQKMLIMYAQGRTLPEIASFCSCTHERVRQMILVGIRRYKLKHLIGVTP